MSLWHSDDYAILLFNYLKPFVIGETKGKHRDGSEKFFAVTEEKNPGPIETLALIVLIIKVIHTMYYQQS